MSDGMLAPGLGSEAADEAVERLMEDPVQEADRIEVLSPSLRRRARLAIGVAAMVAMVVAGAVGKARCALVPADESEQSLVSLAETYSKDTLSLVERDEDPDALIQWLAASSSAGQVAQTAQPSLDLSADASQAVQEAMSTKDPVKAKKIAQRAMKRAMSKTQANRRELKQFVKSKRHSLKRKDKKSPSEKAGTAACVFNVLQAVDSVAFISSNINDAVKTCRGVQVDTMLTRNNTHGKICGINVAFAFAEIANLAASLSLAADNCASTLVPNVDSQCSGAVSGLTYAVAQMAGAGMLVASSCNAKFMGRAFAEGIMPSNVGSNRLLHLPDAGRRLDAKDLDLSVKGPAPARKLLFGGGKGSTATQCFVDASGMLWALAQAGLAINAAANPKNGKSCPPKNLAGGNEVKGPMYKVSEGFCTSDIGGILVGFSQAVALMQLMAVNCEDKLDLKAICGAGVDGVAAAMSAVVQAGSGAWLACDEFQSPLLKKALDAAGQVDTASGGMLTDLIGGVNQAGNFGRRLEDSGVEGGVEELQHRFKTPEDAWKSIGYDLNDPQAGFRLHTLPRVNAEDLTKLVREREDTAGLFGGAPTCEN